MPGAIVVVDGLLRLGHADWFDGNPSHFFYSIVASDGHQWPLDVAAELNTLAPGMHVSASGTAGADGTIAVQQITILAPPPPEAAMATAAAPVTTSYIVLPVKFPTNAAAPWTYAADPFTTASLNTAVFGVAPAQSSAEFYKEVSYGQQLLSGITATDASGGWLLANVATPTSCDINAIATAAENAATARGYNLASYTGRLYVFTNNVPGCGWAGLAYVGWPRAYAKQTSNLLVVSHELGHNFGLAHAASLDCGNNVVGGACSSAEYGDPFDVMGNNRAMHFASSQKNILGYLPAGTVATHTTGTTTYTLTPIETAGGAKYAVKVPATSSRTYWIEYRQPTGTVFDAGLSAFPNNGAQMRLASPFESLCGGCFDDTEFLDMTTATAAFTDGSLVVGQTYTDSLYGISVQPMSATASALTVQVTAPGTTATTTSLLNSPATSTYGSPVTFTATVTGASLTGVANVTESGAAIAGCVNVPVSGGSASCTTSALPAGAHTLAAIYAGDPTHASSTSATVTQTVNKANSATAAASSPNPVGVGAFVTFTATVTSAGGTPAGNVAFNDGATGITGCTAVALNVSGVATCTTSALAIGSHTINFVYAGNSNFNGSSKSLTQVVNNATTTTTIVSHTPNPSPLGTPITVGASVAVNPPGTGTPTGTVTVTDGTTNCAITLPATSCLLTPATTGNKSLTATYGGDPNFSGSTSAAVAQTVVQAPAVTSAPGASFTIGSAGAFTVTATGYPAPTLSVSGALPGGVTFTPATGALAGTPAAGTGGTWPLTFTASNGVAPNATQNFTLTVNVPATVPGQPAAPTAVAGNASATVNFVAPTNGGSPITGYTVVSIPAGGVDTNAGTTLIPHVVTGLTNGTSYTFTVFATNAVGPGPASLPSNSVTPVAGLAPMLTGAVSRKVHGAAGTFDLPLSLTATNPSTEPRTGPAHTIVLSFDKPLIASIVAITEGTATAGSPSISGNTITVPLTGVTDVQYVTISYSGVDSADGGTGGAGVVRLGFLVGDVSQDRFVQPSDLGIIRTNTLKPLGPSNFLFDVTADGGILPSDVALTQSKMLNKLPAP
jgi:hypothetical protein